MRASFRFGRRAGAGSCTTAVEFAIVGVARPEAVLVVWASAFDIAALIAAGWLPMERPFDTAASARPHAVGVAVFNGEELALHCLDVDGTLVAEATAPPAGVRWAQLVPPNGSVRALVIGASSTGPEPANDTDLRGRLRRLPVDCVACVGRVLLANP